VLGDLERMVVVDGERHYRLVHLAAFLGEPDRALTHLETSIRDGFFAAPYIESDPLTAPLHAHPGFAPILQAARQRQAALAAWFPAN
jgi:hypothetical protein